MNANKQILTVVAIAVALTLSSSARAADRPIAASPRAIEVFPWLAPERATQSGAKSFDVKTSSALGEVKKNRALAASPRALEQFPELGRPVRPLEKPSIGSEAAAILKNRALAASPRAIETYPWLARERSVRTSGQTLEIAPLK